MVSISTTRQASDPTAASPSAWATGRGDGPQSETFRALAWSQEDDSLAEPLPYTGDEYSVPEADSRPTVRIADAAEVSSGNRYRRSALLYGITAGFAAAAIGGLLFTVMNTDDGPATISTKVSQPATNVVNSQPNVETVPIRPSAPAPVKPAAAPAHVVSSAVAPSRAFSAPAPAPQTTFVPEAAASAAVPEAAVPEAAVPEAAAPEAPAPEAPAPAAPAAATPEFTPPGAKPPVWVPPVTPQNVPHPVGPEPFHVPVAPEGPMTLPIPHFGASAPAAPVAPAAPAVPNPVISLKPGVTIPPVIPVFSSGSGQ